jgi:CubicO group peptidase (beta-lactamase class C family)
VILRAATETFGPNLRRGADAGAPSSASQQRPLTDADLAVHWARGRARRRRRLLLALVLASLVAAGAAEGVRTWASQATDRSLVARAIAWGDSDVNDWKRFPARPVVSGPTAMRFRQSGTPAGLESVVVRDDGGLRRQPLDEFLAESGTNAFLVLRGDKLLYERYFHGYRHDSIVTSFSVAKSFVSALIGIAIEERAIRSLDDPVTRYLPELLERDPRFGQITLRHLLSMSSGLRYDDGFLGFDGVRTYYGTDLRHEALAKTEIIEPPGTRFSYNNYNPILLGLVLERATGRRVADYLEQKLWRPVGMEAAGSWSLDSTTSGFEKMESGLNARAIDFAKFAALYAREGRWQGRQLVPEWWVRISTDVDVSEDPSLRYEYGWWTPRGAPLRAFYAHGNKGQYLYVVPGADLVVARFGSEYGYPSWPELFAQLARALAG